MGFQHGEISVYEAQIWSAALKRPTRCLWATQRAQNKYPCHNRQLPYAAIEPKQLIYRRL
ncbi:hypothetical protein EJ03DRAFT_325299 [Teratosphaeria nubilosa]|uniref:Uncharacterized protein n=1 Tax=Teratosphaeria nubilosa TaxID=161662 RepID=A0A6G1LGE8_9PEZI|nr:hypothetical protein EJ03DRAFT_325299 [Teratosphaeria nubilosa]